MRRRTTADIYLESWINFAAFLNYIRSGSVPLLNAWVRRTYAGGDTKEERETKKRSLLASLEAQLSEVTYHDVQTYVTALSEQPSTTGQRLKRSTVMTKLAAISYLFTIAMRRGVVSQNPADPKLLPRKRKDPPAPAHVLELEEVMQVLAYHNAVDLLTIRNKALYTVLAWTGMRRQEASELFLMDLSRHPEGMLLKLRRKGDKVGHILLPKKLEETILHYAATIGTKGPLFPSMRRLPCGKIIVRQTPLNPDSITKIVRDMTRDALGAAYGPHKLRHFFANATWDQGGSVEDIQRQLGHEDQRTTLGYLQRKLKRDRSAAELIDLSETK